MKSVKWCTENKRIFVGIYSIAFSLSSHFDILFLKKLLYSDSKDFLSFLLLLCIFNWPGWFSSRWFSGTWLSACLKDIQGYLYMGRQKGTLRHWQLSHLHMKATRKETIKRYSFSWSSQTFLSFPFSSQFFLNLHKPALYISLAHLASSFPVKFLRQAKLPLNSSLIQFIAGRETNFGFSEISTAEASVFTIHFPELTFTLVSCSHNSQWSLVHTGQCRTYYPHH